MKIKVLKFFGGNLNYKQMGKCYLEFETRVRKANERNFIVAVEITNQIIRLVFNAFAFTLHAARNSKSSATELEKHNFVGPVSTK